MQKYMDLSATEVSNIKANFNIDMEALDKVEGFDPVQLAQVKRTLEFNEKALINEVELRLKNAHKDEEAAVMKAMQTRHSEEQILFREKLAGEHAKMRTQLIGESEIVSKEDEFDQHSLQKYEQLKLQENKRRLEKIELEKKKLNAEFEADLNDKAKDYDDMMRKMAEKRAALEREEMTFKDRIEQNKDMLRKKAA